jgi:hypothetical protein
MAEVKYQIRADVELPVAYQGELAYEVAFELVCEWNDHHKPAEMAWLEKCDDGCR